MLPLLWGTGFGLCRAQSVLMPLVIVSSAVGVQDSVTRLWVGVASWSRAADPDGFWFRRESVRHGLNLFYPV